MGDVLAVARRTVGCGATLDVVLDAVAIAGEPAARGSYEAAARVVADALLGCRIEDARTRDRNDAMASAVDVVNALQCAGFLPTFAAVAGD